VVFSSTKASTHKRYQQTAFRSDSEIAYSLGVSAGAAFAFFAAGFLVVAFLVDVFLVVVAFLVAVFLVVVAFLVAVFLVVAFFLGACAVSE
jgi:Flp pilus assembly protein TadB